MTATIEEPRTRVQLALEGMTCASCATRIERKLNKLEGVDATVNFATEQAAVSYDPARAAVDDLIHAVEAAGYHASISARAEADVTCAVAGSRGRSSAISCSTDVPCRAATEIES